MGQGPDEHAAFDVAADRGSDVQVMVDDENTDPPGPMYEVPDLTAFIAGHGDLPVVSPRTPIPDGSVIGYQDPGGNAFYVFDQIERSG